MKKVNILFLLMVTMIIGVSCKKDDVGSDCYECMGPNVANFDVCEENGNFIVNGESLPNDDNITLEQLIQGLENNINDDEVFENLTCNRK